MSFLFKGFSIFMLWVLCAPQVIAGTPAPEGVKLYIISPADGTEVSSPFTVRFGLRGMGVAPAGVERDKTGHHHLLIDVETMPAMDKPLPSDANHRHFGGGQTEVTLDPPRGSHTLQLILGDKDHVPFVPPLVSDRIRIMVK